MDPIASELEANRGGRLLKNIASLAVSELAGKGLAMIYTIWLARSLGPEGYGIFKWSMVFSGYFVLFTVIGLEVFSIREISRDKSKMEKYVNNITAIKLAIGTGLFIVYAAIVLFFLDAIRNEPATWRTIIIALVAGSQIFTVGSQIIWVFQGIERMELLALRSVITAGGNLAGVAIFVRSPEDALAAMVIIALSLLINNVWVAYYYIKKFHPIKLEFDKAFWKKTLISSAPLGIGFLIITFYNTIDVFMLGMLRSDADTGIYSAAHSIMTMTLLFSSILQGAFFPVFSRVEKSERDLTMSKYSLLTQLVGAFLAAFMFVYAPSITFALGSKYANSAYALRILSATIFFVYLTITYYCPLVAWGHEKKILPGNVAGLIMNICLNIYFIPRYGAYGAAYSTIFSELAVLAYFSVIFYKVAGKLYLKETLLPLAIAIVACLPGLYFEGSPWSFAVMPLSAGLFVGIVLISKVVDLNDVKRYLKK
ncbi:MAG: flippase [Chloroflexota bacterium]